MEYNDLENYFFENFLEMKKYIQPNVKTIGWLGKNSIFHQGSFLKRGEFAAASIYSSHLPVLSSYFLQNWLS